MQMFPSSAAKKRDIYPSYMVKKAQIEGIDLDVDVDEAFDAIKDLPMFGNEAPCEDGPCPEEVSEISDETEEGVEVDELEGAEGTEGNAIEKAQDALEDVQEAVEEAAAAVEEVAAADATEVAQPVEDINDNSFSEEISEDIPGVVDDDSEDSEVAEIEVEIEDDGEDDDEAPDGDDLLKEGEDDIGDAMPEKKKPAVEEGEEGESKPQVAKIEGTLEFAGASGNFVRMSHLSPQNAKEVYEYWVALGLPKEFCKAMTKNYE